jgi:hypothetical protein
MSALEQEIIAKFAQLDDEAKARVRSALVESPSTTEADWLEQARALREEMRAKYGTLRFSAVDLLNEAREERLNDLTRRY